MKNSQDYSKQIQKQYRTLSRKYPKVQKISHETVLDAIVYAIISAYVNEKQTESSIKKLTEYFVDWNDLRVSRSEEIIEVLGKESSTTIDMASTFIRILNSIFNDYHRMSLESLKKIGKRPAKAALEKIDGISRYIVDYCLLTALGGHAIPLTDKMIKYLRDNELVNPDADQQQISGFLAKQISAKNGYEFYVLLRHESETAKDRQKTRVKSSHKKKTAKKTISKKTKTRKKRKK